MHQLKSRFLSFWILVFLVFSLVPAHAQSNREELFLVAQKAFEDGFYDVAIRYIEQYLQEFPGTEKQTQAQLLLGQCYFFKKQYLKAYETFQGLLEHPEFKDATLFWLGETYFKGSDYQQAEKYYRQLIDVYPESAYRPQGYYSLGWTYFEQGRYPEAKGLFLKLAQEFPAHPLSEDASFKLGECEYDLGSYETAVDYFQAYLLRYPQSTRHAESYFYIGESYYYLEDYLTAITYYAKAADIAYDPKITVTSKVSMGWSYLKLGKHDLSRRHFEEAFQLAQEKNILSDDIFLGLATLYADAGENQKALDAYSQMIEQFPNSPRLAEAQLGKANTYYARKEYGEAIAEYEKIINQYAPHPQQQNIVEKASYGLAWTHLKSGQIDQAIQAFEAIMNKTESKIVKVSTLTQIGDAYQDINELEKAIQIYDRILKDYPDSIYTDYAQFRQGIALLKLNKLESATLAFQSLQANFPESKYLHDVKYYLGLAYFKKEEWSQAIRYIKDYLEGSPQTDSFIAESRYILALSHFHLENYEQALEIFEKITQESPQKAMVQIANLSAAKCLYNLNRIPEALKKFEDIQTKYPDTEVAQEALWWLGDHYLNQGDFHQAVAYYQKFVQAFPGSERINIIEYQLGQAYEALDQLDEALNHYKRITETADKLIYAKARLAIADIFSKDLDPAKAVATYRNIADSVPEYQRNAYIKVAGIYQNNHQYPEAIQAYEEALKSGQALSEVSDAELHFQIGDTYEILNENDKAVETYLKIPYLYAKETPWVIKAYLRTARIFEGQEKWEEAKTIYQKVLDYKTEESKYANERIDWIEENIL